MQTGKPAVILMAEDDDDDFELAQDALAEAKVLNELHRVYDGRELLEYLRGDGAFAGQPPRRPSIILLDLNMPRKDGRQALAELKADPDLRTIPVVVLTTSQTQEDVVRSYELGVSSYIRKPVTFEGLVQVVQVFGQYWFEIVELPRTDAR